MIDFQSALALIKSAPRILFTTHARPDGDALGCLGALESGIHAVHTPVQTQLLLLTPCPDHYRFLLGQDPWVMGQNLTEEQVKTGRLDEFDLIIVADTAAKRQLPGIGDYLTARKTGVLVFDHHLSHDSIGAVRVIDTSAAAAGEIVFALFQAGGWPIGPFIADALFTAIATDTGWFRFENVHTDTLTIAGQLIACGARPDVLYRRLFQEFPPERLKLQARMVETLELHENNRLAVMHITNDMLRETGARRSYIENFVNEPMQIGAVEAVLLLVEQEDATTRASLRSRCNLDVNAVAQVFGGGGHARAAGVTLNEKLPIAREILLAAMKAALVEKQ
ncbi:MAG: DHH family phosphoesterase [Sedimentisphaerales bacterium]|nr:DHH family phosphoesterase [Sedimentisphaerales bacterium]